MPLTNETHLRNALDALFYKDTILTRLRAIDFKNYKIDFQQPIASRRKNISSDYVSGLRGAFKAIRSQR
jgi:hypothetical protein